MFVFLISPVCLQLLTDQSEQAASVLDRLTLLQPMRRREGAVLWDELMLAGCYATMLHARFDGGV